MNNQKHSWFRILIIFVLALAVGFAIYQNFANKKTEAAGQLNEQAPNFKWTTLAGEKINLKDLYGKAVLVNFWASWCGPCKKEMPVIEQAYQQYKNDRFEVVAVNIQEPDATVKNFLKDHQLTFPVVLDKTGDIYDSWGVNNIPVSYFISPDGTIKRKFEGEMSKEQLDQWIKELLKL
ncbi:thiol-disulfide oxidoreductase ResA [Bacillus changyiensis]|uniref:thiol-disulfide oxidoreductase ResA n=1 Tax=Bacillus changyiensis TaxID=3004103 RepID=UPI0022DED570|nr:thiol-disulfide oxidoreductase ResA [Bacillus changyiensis]MDA1475168.1 thiol-disulfide oxidoreductase ResA [Bacillus changyiensis]